MSKPITKAELDSLEKAVDKLFQKYDVDVEFTKHFLDRLNDPRNKKQISLRELAALFVKEYKRWGRRIGRMPPSAEAVMKDLSTDLNVPFVLNKSYKDTEKDLVAKTIMRKKKFHTKDPILPVESHEPIKYQDVLAEWETLKSQLNQTRKEARKFGNKIDKNGCPPVIYPNAKKNSTPNVLFNLGLTEALDMPHPDETLGIKRSNMPQIPKKFFPELFQYLMSHGGNLVKKTFDPRELKPTQRDFSKSRIKKMIKKVKKNKDIKPIIVSKDGYVVDGHHRWLAAVNMNKPIPGFQISIPIKTLLDLLRDFKHVNYKDVYKEYVSPNVTTQLLDVPTPTPRQIAKKHGIRLDDVMAQLRKGIKVEREHTTDPKVAREIALDHLNEYPDYYDRLEKYIERD